MKKMGIIEKDLRASLSKYKEKGDLLTLLKEIVHQSDGHIYYYWQYELFLDKLVKVYEDTFVNENPSHREGKIRAKLSSR
jgi:hypothetical protein